ncbi:FAD-binding oxidoreductase [Kribbella sp. NBC_00359]|uniref:FAD-binding oxidoreductase n=1 Tax=Kribbella sp. NBC_00359 TaxID=2975966 RepID=UPI002E1ADECE
MSENILLDFSGYRTDGPHHRLVVPDSVEEVRTAVLAANVDRVPVRIRGNGHGMNGANIPLDGEIVVRTSALNHYRFGPEGTVTVGAGAAVGDVDTLLKSHGYALPVIADSIDPGTKLSPEPGRLRRIRGLRFRQCPLRRLLGERAGTGRCHRWR